MISKRLNWKLTLAVLAGLAIVLGISHHAINFWGLEIWREALLLLLAVPVLSFLIFLFVNRVWDVCLKIERRRWLFFLFPALIVAAILTWRCYLVPSVWHTLEIIPAPGHAAGRIELYEIKLRPGKAAKLSQIQNLDGWVIEDGVLKTVSENPQPLRYSYFEKIGATTSLLFMRSPDSRDVTVILDGKKLGVSLYSLDASLQPVEMTTAYKLGIPGGLILFIVAVMDFSAFFFFILFIWVIQEIAQLVPAEERHKKNECFPSHRANLIILLTLAVILHALSFFSVPLITASDSLGYLNGAIHWLEDHNFNGVPASRGPGTTFLFIPAFLLFGTDPTGVKLTLHLFAIACVPLLYRLGWQLFKRRSFAFFSGLIAILMPEMYLFSNFVMSEVLNVFFTLAYCSLLIAALETFSWKNSSACMLTGSFAALLRPENMTLLAIGTGLLFIKIVWDKQAVRERMKILGIVFFLALLPLLWWSAHNNRVHGFFGLSNYADEVLYDGWVYFGEASGFQITDHDSPAVQAIAAAVQAYAKPLDETLVPTGWEIFPALIEHGYTEQQALKLLGDAARDSIRKDPGFALQLYFVKLKKGFTPIRSGVEEQTFIPIEENGKIVGAQPYDLADYFESEQTVFFAFIPWQLKIYDWLPAFDRYVYRPLVFFCLAMALLALYQKRFFIWTPVVAIALSRMIVPITIGIAHWQYMLAGIAILLTFTFLGFETIQGFLSFWSAIPGQNIAQAD
jgi:4-amino-4-deoxy-L-arabinose transferase-like glycosyltransferase